MLALGAFDAALVDQVVLRVCLAKHQCACVDRFDGFCARVCASELMSTQRVSKWDAIAKSVGDGVE